MRFDEVSARFGEFGPSTVGLVTGLRDAVEIAGATARSARSGLTPNRGDWLEPTRCSESPRPTSLLRQLASRTGKNFKVPAFGTVSAHFAGSAAGTIRTYVRHTGGDGRSGAGASPRGASARGALDLRAGGASQAAAHGDRARGRRRWRLAGGGLLVERAVAGADLQQRLPQRRADHADQQRAAQPARARPRAEHGRADARPGRSRRRVRDPGERRRAGAPRGRQGAERDRAGRAHARPARGGRRPGAL